VGRRRLLIVTGKGGVGKTSVTAAMAIAAARAGSRVLACEMDGSGRLAASLGSAPVGFEPSTITLGDDVSVDAMSMDTERALREYVRLFVKIPFADRVGSLARIFDYVADAAPGVREILAIGKVCHEVRRDNYDLVVVDAESTGHVVSQIDAPRAMSEFVHSGVIAEQTGWMSEILEDPERTGVVVVTVAEGLPVSETGELIDTITGRTGVSVASVIVNRVPEAGLDRTSVEALAAARDLGITSAAGVLAAVERADRASGVLGDLLGISGVGVAGAVLPEIDLADDEAMIAAGLAEQIDALVAHLTSEHDGENE
jgi:anion-transporting  ArsA/GET3 family ATPase